GNDGVVTLGGFPLDTLLGGTSQNYMVTYDFSASAATGTYVASVLSNGDVTGAGLISGRPILVTGAPIFGSTITVANPTATATNSPTNSPTITPTSTLTNTPTDTPTATPTTSPTNSPTNTSTSSSTNTPTNSPTNSPTNTPTNSPTTSPTNTPT